MKYSSLISITSVMVIFMLASPVLAQTATPTPLVSPTDVTSPLVTAMPEESPTSAVSPVATPSTPLTFGKKAGSISLLRFRRFFTANKLKKSELTLAITDALAARLQTGTQDDPATQASLLASYQRESTYLQTISDVIAANATDPAVKTFLDTAFADRTTQLGLLQTVSPQAASEAATRLINIRAKVLSDLVRTLEKPDLTDAERQAKLSQLIDKYTRHQTKIDEKITEKLALTNTITTQTDAVPLAAAVQTEEDKIVGDASTLGDADRESIVSKIEKGDSEHSLLVLQRLLDRVPAEARPGVETAINAMVAKQAEKFKQNPNALLMMLENNKDTSPARQEILDRLKKSNPTLKTTIEADAVKKEAEKARKKGEPAPKPSPHIENRASSTPKTENEHTATPTSTSTPNQVSDSSVSVKILTTGFDKTSYSVKSGSKLTIEFENNTTESRTLTLSNGRSSGAVAANGKVKLEAFTITGTVTFSTVVAGTTYTGTITVE